MNPWIATPVPVSDFLSLPSWGWKDCPLQCPVMGVAVVATSVLIVEDDPTARELYRSALRRSGYTVVTAEDGLAALRQVDSIHPDLIVLDMALPRLSGRDVHRELQANPETRGIPVIVVTGNDTSDLDERAFARVMRKPIDVETLQSEIEHCLHRRLW
jgi:CheY-like chemotaxis protein